MSIIRLGPVVLIAMLAASCSDSAATPTSPTAGNGTLALTASDLAGTWTLTSLQEAGGAAQSVPAGASYTLSFSEARLSTRADCNSCGGAFTLSGRTLTAGPTLACTLAACSTMTFERAYMVVLSGESSVSLTGSTLVLSSARGTLYLSR